VLCVDGRQLCGGGSGTGNGEGVYFASVRRCVLHNATHSCARNARSGTQSTVKSRMDRQASRKEAEKKGHVGTNGVRAAHLI